MDKISWQTPQQAVNLAKARRRQLYAKKSLRLFLLHLPFTLILFVVLHMRAEKNLLWFALVCLGGIALSALLTAFIVIGPLWSGMVSSSSNYEIDERD